MCRESSHLGSGFFTKEADDDLLFYIVRGLSKMGSDLLSCSQSDVHRFVFCT